MTSEADYSEVRDYLQELANQLPLAKAAEAQGLSRNSFNSILDLYAYYGVENPKRVNQYGVADGEVEQQESAPSVTPFRLNRAMRRQLGVERAVVVNDIHCPFHDERALAIVLAVIEDIQPEVIFFAGDIVDFYALSRFDKDPTRALQLQVELDVTVDVLRAFREAAPEARMVFIYGNHEARLKAYLETKATALHGLRCLTVEQLLCFDELGIESVKPKGKEAYTQYGGIKIGHFDALRAASAATEKVLVDKHACSLVQGHSHRLGKFYFTYPGGKMVVGIGNGCLCQLDPEYVSDPNWQQGFCVITRAGDTFHAVDVAITNSGCQYNDTLYNVA